MRSLLLTPWRLCTANVRNDGEKSYPGAGHELEIGSLKQHQAFVNSVNSHGLKWPLENTNLFVNTTPRILILSLSIFESLMVRIHTHCRSFSLKWLMWVRTVLTPCVSQRGDGDISRASYHWLCLSQTVVINSGWGLTSGCFLFLLNLPDSQDACEHAL